MMGIVRWAGRIPAAVTAYWLGVGVGVSLLHFRPTYAAPPQPGHFAHDAAGLVWDQFSHATWHLIEDLMRR